MAGPAPLPSAYLASMVASWSPRNWVGMANEAVVPLAADWVGGSYEMMLICQGTPWEKRASMVALTPAARLPASRVSADAVSVRVLPETV